MKKIRILHLAQSAGYGVSIYVESLIKGLDKNRFEQILLGSDYYYTNHFRYVVDKLVTIRMDRNISKHDLKTILECRTIIKRANPDIVYCHSAKAGIYGRIACIGRGTKVVYNPHGWSFNMKCSWIKKAFYKFVETVLSLMTDKIVVISDYERKTTPFFIPQNKIRKIVNGIDTRQCERILKEQPIKRKDVGIPENAFVIGLVARISIQKGQDLFVKVSEWIIKKMPETYFMIVGGKSDDISIEKMIRNSGLSERVIITGVVSDAIRYASLFDVAVLTSRWEGFGLVLPEYMIAQKPVVAFDVDAVSEIVLDGKTGILVDKEDCEGMADAIVELYLNKEKAHMLAQAGYNRAKKEFDMARVIAEHNKMFINLIMVG